MQFQFWSNIHNFLNLKTSALLAGAIEYANSTSAKGVRPPPPQWMSWLWLNSLWWWGPSSWIWGLIAITPRSTLTQISCTCLGAIYGSNKTVQLFTKDYYFYYLLLKTIDVCKLFILHQNTWSIELLMLNSNTFNYLTICGQMIDIK